MHLLDHTDLVLRGFQEWMGFSYSTIASSSLRAAVQRLHEVNRLFLNQAATSHMSACVHHQLRTLVLTAWVTEGIKFFYVGFMMGLGFRMGLVLGWGQLYFGGWEKQIFSKLKKKTLFPKVLGLLSADVS